MTTVFAPRTELQALYPPTVVAPPRPLPLRRFLLTFVRNPLSSLPRPVYEEPDRRPRQRPQRHRLGHGPGSGRAGAAARQCPIPQDAAREAGVRSHAGRGHPHLRRRELALATAHRGAAVPPRRTFRAGADHDEGCRGPSGALAHERSRRRPCDRPRHDRDHVPCHLGDDVRRQRRRRGRRDPQVGRHGARYHLLGYRRGHAAVAHVDVVSGQIQTPQGGADIASRRCDDPGAPPRRRPRRRRPAGAPGTRAGPRDRRADVGKAAHRQSRDLSRRRPRDHRQGADLDALLARPRAGVAGAHPRGGRRRRR